MLSDVLSAVGKSVRRFWNAVPFPLSAARSSAGVAGSGSSMRTDEQLGRLQRREAIGVSCVAAGSAS